MTNKMISVAVNPALLWMQVESARLGGVNRRESAYRFRVQAEAAIRADLDCDASVSMLHGLRPDINIVDADDDAETERVRALVVAVMDATNLWLVRDPLIVDGDKIDRAALHEKICLAYEAKSLPYTQATHDATRGVLAVLNRSLTIEGFAAALEVQRIAIEAALKVAKKHDSDTWISNESTVAPFHALADRVFGEAGKLAIAVTAQDVINGQRDEPSDNPVALAIRRRLNMAVGGGLSVAVRTRHIKSGRVLTEFMAGDSGGFFVWAPADVRDWLRSYDAGETVPPLKFTLSLADGCGPLE